MLFVNRRYEMKPNLILSLELAVVLLLLNIVSHLFGLYFIKDYYCCPLNF